MEESDYKDLLVLCELEISEKLIRSGLGEVQNLSWKNDAYFKPMQLLSQGIERFMKIYICLAYHAANGCYPNTQFVKSLNHNLNKLKELIVTDYFDSTSRSILGADKQSLLNDKDMNKVLDILSNFGIGGRYYNLDYITGRNKLPMNAIDQWEEFEDELLKRNPEKHSLVGDIQRCYEAFDYTNQQIVMILERFLSPLSRQFYFGSLGQLGQRYSSVVSHYNGLEGNTFGITDYRINTTMFMSEKRSGRERQDVDEENRKSNPCYKHKVIQKSEVDFDWPFYSESVIIEQRDTHWNVVTIDNVDYGLNGAAQMKYQMASPHEAGVAILGISIYPLNKLASEL